MTLWPRSLVGRNALLIVGLLVVAQAVSVVLVSRLIVRPRVEQVADAVARHVVAMRAGLSALPPAERDAFLDAFDRRRGEVDAKRSTAGEPAPRLTRLERIFIAAVSAQLGESVADIAWRRDGERSLALTLRLDGRLYWLRLPAVLPEREFTGAWLAATMLAALFAVGGALAIQRRIDRPLRALVDAAATLGRGARPMPLLEDGPTEIASVSRRFNELAQSLETADRERALMLAGISHDLRTPLTKLRLGVDIAGEAIDAPLAATMARSIDEIDAIVGQFLEFARADDTALPLEPTRLDALARDVIGGYAGDDADAARPSLDAVAVSALPLRAGLVRRGVVNLVENARRHGRPPIVVRTGSDAAFGWIEVEDAGDGIAPADVEALKQPFRRAGEARSGAPGAGLGLAIADRVANSHGGRFDLLPASPHGLRARLSFPRPIAG